MPRFYFDLFMGPHSNRDEEGHEIVDIGVAAIEAARRAGELVRDRLLVVHEVLSEDVRVEVRNEHRRPVLTVTISVRGDETETSAA